MSVALLFSFHTIVNVYLPQIITSVGGGNKELGFAIALAGICEIPVMFGFSKLEKQFNVITLLKISVFFFFVKAVVYVLAPNFITIQIAQLLQSLSFALITPGYAHLINEWMEPKDRVKGQTFMMAGVTLGNVLGGLFGGQALDFGGVGWLLLLGLFFATVGMLLLFVSLRGKKGITDKKLQV